MEREEVMEKEGGDGERGSELRDELGELHAWQPIEQSR